MARTKKTPKRERYDAGTVTVISSHPHFFYLNLGVRIRHREGDADHVEEPRDLDQHGIDPGTNVIPLGTYLKKEEVLSWTLGIHEYGTLWRSSEGGDDEGDAIPYWQAQAELHGDHVPEQWTIRVLPGGTYYVDNDPQNMLLTDVQFTTLHDALLKQLQKSSPYSELWNRVRRELVLSPALNQSFGPRIPQNLDRAYRSYDFHRISRLPHWLNDFPKVEVKAGVGDNDWVTQKELDKGLVVGGRARIDVYWRCLDRQPGGNTDVHTICYTFDCEKQTVSTRTVGNWDGSVRRCEYKPRELSERMIRPTDNNTDPAAATSPRSFGEFLMALRGLGPGDSECTILDATSYDPDAYDTTWTSHEIVAFLPRPWSPSCHGQFPVRYRRCAVQFLLVLKKKQLAQFPSEAVHKILEFAAPSALYRPVTRLHQRCVFGTQWGNYNGLREIYKTEIPPTDGQEAALRAIRNFVGMGRVNTWTDAGDGRPACDASKDERIDLVCDNSCTDHFSCTLHPFYFNFPARNIAGEKREGTSADWTQTGKKKRSREEEGK